MTKEYTWTVTYDLDVDFDEIYELYEPRNEYKLDLWAISQAVTRYFARMDDEIYYTLDGDVTDKVEEDFTEWLKDKIDWTKE